MISGWEKSDLPVLIRGAKRMKASTVTQVSEG